MKKEHVGGDQHSQKGRTSLEEVHIESEQYAETPKWSSLIDNFSEYSGRRHFSHTRC